MSEIKVNVVKYSDRKNLLLVYRDDVTGERLTRSAGTSKMREAMKAAGQWEAELREGRYRRVKRITWKEFRQRYESESLSVKSPDYRNNMRAALGHYERLMKPQRLANVTTEAISRFTSRLRNVHVEMIVSPSRRKPRQVKETTIRTYLKHLRAAISWGYNLGLLAVMPKFEMPKVVRESNGLRGRAITLEEFERMQHAVDLLAADERETAIRPETAHLWKRYLWGLWLSGLRLSESLALSWDDDALISVDLLGRHPLLQILAEGQKSRRDEPWPLVPDFADWLLRTPDDERHGHVFVLVNVDGSQPNSDWVSRVVCRIGRKANVVVNKQTGKFASAHDLRRSFGTRWASRVKPAVLQKLMRHQSINTTMHYYVTLDADDVASTLWEQHPPNTLGTPPERPEMQPDDNISGNSGRKRAKLAKENPSQL